MTVVDAPGDDYFLTAVNFDETKHYVRKVMNSYERYRSIYGDAAPVEGGARGAVKRRTGEKSRAMIRVRLSVPSPGAEQQAAAQNDRVGPTPSGKGCRSAPDVGAEPRPANASEAGEDSERRQEDSGCGEGDPEGGEGDPGV